MKYNTARVMEHWSEVDCSELERTFHKFPPIRDRSCELVFGESNAGEPDWAEKWTVEKYLRHSIPFDKCLSVGCGFGSVERSLAKLDVAREIVGTDIAPGAIEEAKRRAEAEHLSNIRYYVADLNREQLPSDEYDVIWANGSLHHMADVDGVVSRLYSALRDGGYLVANEYVGPQYQQIESRQQELVNAAKHLLPRDLRGKVLYPRPNGQSILARAIRSARRRLRERRHNEVYGVLWERQPVEDFLAKDPSECVGSHLVIPALKKHFEHVDVRYFNGSLLFYALDATFYENYDPRNPRHVNALKMLFYVEDALAEAGEIAQDNAHIICRKGREVLSRV